MMGVQQVALALTLALATVGLAKSQEMDSLSDSEVYERFNTIGLKIVDEWSLILRKSPSSFSCTVYWQLLDGAITGRPLDQQHLYNSTKATQAKAETFRLLADWLSSKGYRRHSLFAHANLCAKNTDYQKEIAHKKALTDLQAELEKAREELAAAKGVRPAADAGRRQAESENVLIWTEIRLQALKNNNEQLQVKLNECLVEKSTLVGDLERLKAQEGNRLEPATCEHQLESARSDGAKLNLELERAKKELAETAKRSGELEMSHAKLDGQFSLLQATIEQLRLAKANNDQLKSDLTLERAKEGWARERSALTNGLERLRTQLAYSASVERSLGAGECNEGQLGEQLELARRQLETAQAELSSSKSELSKCLAQCQPVAPIGAPTEVLSAAPERSLQVASPTTQTAQGRQSAFEDNDAYSMMLEARKSFDRRFHPGAVSTCVGPSCGPFKQPVVRNYSKESYVEWNNKFPRPSKPF